MPTFIYPTKVERITSGFRTPERKNHHGIDFALAGDHEIYAVADGVVQRSYLSTSYGECIMIVHEIAGQVWESVYAHMRSGSRTVKEGQLVKQGQVLGIMGSTGDSTGQHLHFELHKGRWNANKTNAVNPLEYLSKTGVEQQPETKEDKKQVVEGLTTIIYQGKQLQGVIIDSRSYAPVRELAELLGVSVKWNEETRTVELKK